MPVTQAEERLSPTLVGIAHQRWWQVTTKKRQQTSLLEVTRPVAFIPSNLFLFYFFVP